jgi:hypothetical protein
MKLPEILDDLGMPPWDSMDVASAIDEVPAV